MCYFAAQGPLSAFRSCHKCESESLGIILLCGEAQLRCVKHGETESLGAVREPLHQTGEEQHPHEQHGVMNMIIKNVC